MTCLWPRRVRCLIVPAEINFFDLFVRSLVSVLHFPREMVRHLASVFRGVMFLGITGGIGARTIEITPCEGRGADGGGGVVKSR